MKRIIAILLVLTVLMLSACTNADKEITAMTRDININQLGYYPDDKKIAVLRGDDLSDDFRVVNAKTGDVVYSGKLTSAVKNSSADETNRFADFSVVREAGEYYIENEKAGKSYVFSVGDDVYSDAFNKVVKMFYLQRCGQKLPFRYAKSFRHTACHTELATVYETGEKIDVSGGWHDAGDYGRYTVAGAKAVTDLMLAYRRNPEKFTDNTGIPESKNGIPDILDEIRYELEWMLKMQCSDGGVYHKVTGKDFPDAVMPQKEKDMLVTPVSTTATGDFAGAMAVAYVVYKEVDADFADNCLAKAELAWSYLEQNSDFIYRNIDEIVTGEYGDSSDNDERYFAASALFAATGDSRYLDFAKELLQKGITAELGWQSMGAYGSYLLLNSENKNTIDKDTYSLILRSFQQEAERIIAVSEKDGYSSSLDENGYIWGSNMNVCNNAMLLIMMNDISPDEKYISTAKEHFDYIFGRNPNSISYVTGTGTVSPKHPHHRPSIYKNSAMQGMLAGGPDSYLDDDCAKQELSGKAPAKCYIDNDASYSTNEITIYWNSPLVFLMSEYI